MTLNYSKVSRDRIRWLTFLFLLSSSLLELLLWAKFPFGGYDSFSHIYWIAEWHKLWQLGIYYPRWLPDSFHGFGAPSFYYYPPLPFFLSSIFYAFLPNFTADDIGKLLGILAFAFSFISMWLYLRWRSENHKYIIGRSATVFASLLYTFAPYRIFNYATRGALPEHIAFGFVPLAFWGIDLILTNSRRSGYFLLVLSLSLLILTNLPATAVAGVGIFLYVIFQKRSERVSGLKWLAGCGIAAILLTAFYVFPVWHLFGLVQMERLWRAVPFVQSTPFLAIFTGQALTINGYTFIMLLGALALFVVWSRSTVRPRPLFWILFVLIAAQLPVVTQYLYRFIPPFTIVQLASRFSILLLFIMAVAWQDEWNENLTTFPIVTWVVAFWSVCTIGLVSLQLADVHLHKHGPLPIGEAPEYATKWAKPYYVWGDSLAVPFKSNSQIIAGENVTIVRSDRFPYSDTTELIASKPTTAIVRRAYWPEWKAEIDGITTSLLPDSLGRVTTLIPTGKHLLTVELAEAPITKIGTWISICSLFLSGISVFFIPNSIFRRRVRSTSVEPITSGVPSQLRSSEYAPSLHRSEGL